MIVRQGFECLVTDRNYVLLNGTMWRESFGLTAHILFVIIKGPSCLKSSSLNLPNYLNVCFVSYSQGYC